MAIGDLHSSVKGLKGIKAIRRNDETPRNISSVELMGRWLDQTDNKERYNASWRAGYRNVIKIHEWIRGPVVAIETHHCVGRFHNDETRTYTHVWWTGRAKTDPHGVKSSRESFVRVTLTDRRKSKLLGFVDGFHENAQTGYVSNRVSRRKNDRAIKVTKWTERRNKTGWNVSIIRLRGIDVDNWKKVRVENFEQKMFNIVAWSNVFWLLL